MDYVNLADVLANLKKADDLTTALDLVESMPTIDPVVHSRWFLRSKTENNITSTVFECDACKNSADNYTAYCPQCGAKMDADQILPRYVIGAGYEVENALCVMKNDDNPVYSTDEEAARAAERDGYKIIWDIETDAYYLDTPENRALVKAYYDGKKRATPVERSGKWSKHPDGTWECSLCKNVNFAATPRCPFCGGVMSNGLATNVVAKAKGML